MFNVKSRKLVFTLFCSLALVLVLTDGASANAQLDGHRMLRRRSPALLARQKLSDIIDDGTKGDGENPVNSVSSVSSQVSTDLSLLGRIPNDANVLCLLAAGSKLFTITFAYFRCLAHALPLSELQFQPERVLFEFLLFIVDIIIIIVLLLFYSHASSFHSNPTERCPFVVSHQHPVPRSEDRIQDCHFL
jgi:hypothetical protein